MGSDRSDPFLGEGKVPRPRDYSGPFGGEPPVGPLSGFWLTPLIVGVGVVCSIVALLILAM